MAGWLRACRLKGFFTGGKKSQAVTARGNFLRPAHGHSPVSLWQLPLCLAGRPAGRIVKTLNIPPFPSAASSRHCRTITTVTAVSPVHYRQQQHPLASSICHRHQHQRESRGRDHDQHRGRAHLLLLATPPRGFQARRSRLPALCFTHRWRCWRRRRATFALRRAASSFTGIISPFFPSSIISLQPLISVTMAGSSMAPACITTLGKPSR